MAQKTLVSPGSRMRGAVPRPSKEVQSRRGIDEKAQSIFQVDVLAPVQYYATFHRRLHLSPERILMLAILQDAVTCFQSYVGSRHDGKRRLHVEAESWFLDEDHRHAFSFENVCDALGLNASFLRRGLMRWKTQVLLTPGCSRVISGAQGAKASLPARTASISG
jgi:hypothetical protein